MFRRLPLGLLHLGEHMPLKVLVIDQNAAESSLVNTVLGREGYQVATATSLEEGLSTFRASRFDLLLLSGETERDTAADWWEDARGALSDVPIILLGEGDEAIPVAARLNTPLDSHALVGEVRAQLQPSDPTSLTWLPDSLKEDTNEIKEMEAMLGWSLGSAGKSAANPLFAPSSQATPLEAGATEPQTGSDEQEPLVSDLNDLIGDELDDSFDALEQTDTGADADATTETSDSANTNNALDELPEMLSAESDLWVGGDIGSPDDMPDELPDDTPFALPEEADADALQADDEDALAEPVEPIEPTENIDPAPPVVTMPTPDAIPPLVSAAPDTDHGDAPADPLPQALAGVPREQVEAILHKVIREVVEAVVWETVPRMVTKVLSENQAEQDKLFVQIVERTVWETLPTVAEAKVQDELKRLTEMG